MRSIKLYCDNGLFRWHPSEVETTIIQTTCETYDEDTINSNLPIPTGTKLDIIRCYQNLYGCFIEVVYNEKVYSIKPKYVEVI